MYTTFTRVDNRTCPQCGARAGQCEHMKADPGVVGIYQTAPREFEVARDKTDLHSEALVRAKPCPKNREYMPWESAEVKTLKALRAEGKSFGQIAKLVGRSRSAVAGKLSRIEEARQ